MRAASSRGRRAVVAACAAGVLLTACGGAGDEAATLATTAPATTTAPTEPASDDGVPTPVPGDRDEGGNGDHKPPGDDVPPPGTTFTGEPITAEHAADLQEEVDEGHEPWRLDQSRVAAVFASNRFGWDDVEIALEDPHTVQVTDTAGRHVVSLQLRQPVCEGPTGIWVVDSGVWLG